MKEWSVHSLTLTEDAFGVVEEKDISVWEEKPQTNLLAAFLTSSLTH